MFCKYCGQNIPDIAEFCPECGKKLKHKENEELERRQALSTPLALMFFMLCWNTLRAWGNMLLFDNQLSLAALLSTVMLAAALVLFAILAGRDMIHMEDYR
ncbi:MAG: zinc ribbon domain-containing protein, partial [Peptococcaceae bacterium]|nr:zinc ribbon domain-containing protein [Peptococcaceae bacterium]